jgi:uncharacterized membrane protein YidH (DUF202 family)
VSPDIRSLPRPAQRPVWNTEGSPGVQFADLAAFLGTFMSGNRIIGLVLVAVGIVLLVFGMNASQAPVDQVTQTFTGRFTQTTMTYLIIGVVAVVGGGLLALMGRRA